MHDSGPSLYRPAAIQRVDILRLIFNKLYGLVCLHHGSTDLSSEPFSCFELHDCLMNTPSAGRREPGLCIVMLEVEISSA